MIYFLAYGAGLGLTAGLSPGPLMALIITESLQGGWPAGFRVALAPLITDSVMLTVALVIAAPLPTWALSAISVIGGGIIVWMGLGTLRAGAPVAAEVTGGGRGPFAKGVMTNLLNPNAFLFWLTAGGPILLDAWHGSGWTGPVSFMAPFYAVMIAINLILAFTISRGRQFLQGTPYRWTLRAAGVVLMGLGAWRAWQGLSAFI